MPTAENAKLEYEAAQQAVAMVELTDQGDAKDFKSAANLWSNRSGYEPDVRPNGLTTGGVISPAASASDDVVDVSAATAYLSGVLRSPGASTDLSVPRPTVSNYQKLSITITNAGAFAVVEGTEGSSFSDTRGAAGGPAWIDNDAIEIGQVWYDSQSAAPVQADEIYQVVGIHLERWDYPLWLTEYIDVESGVLGFAGINFYSALPEIHSEDAGTNTYGKDVFASYNVPVFAEIIDAFDFVPPAASHTVSSTQVYGRVKGAKASSINQGTFSFEMVDGITDSPLQFVDDNLWFRFYQDRLKNPYMLTQGSLGVVATFSAGENIQAACTISAEVVADRVLS
jgi:hypothetical protein